MGPDPDAHGAGPHGVRSHVVLRFPCLSWALWIPLALLYSISISWSINSTSHNFIHNAFFTSPLLNRIYSVILSLSDGFSQEFYHHVHLRHHVGNMDRIGASGTTIDPLSIWRHGHNGKPESPWTYTFYSYFRDDIGEVYKRVKEKFPHKARWIWREIYIVVGIYSHVLLTTGARSSRSCRSTISAIRCRR
jgi:hypothetical protein